MGGGLQVKGGREGGRGGGRGGGGCTSGRSSSPLVCREEWDSVGLSVSSQPGSDEDRPGRDH